MYTERQQNIHKQLLICTCPGRFDTRLGKWASANFHPCARGMFHGISIKILHNLNYAVFSLVFRVTGKSGV